MNKETFDSLPASVKAAVVATSVIDPAVPNGQVEVRPEGSEPYRLPAVEFARRVRARRKRERQNRRRGRAKR